MLAVLFNPNISPSGPDLNPGCLVSLQAVKLPLPSLWGSSQSLQSTA